jgi:hypothetical protein
MMVEKMAVKLVGKKAELTVEMMVEKLVGMMD